MEREVIGRALGHCRGRPHLRRRTAGGGGRRAAAGGHDDADAGRSRARVRSRSRVDRLRPPAAAHSEPPPRPRTCWRATCSTTSATAASSGSATLCNEPSRRAAARLGFTYEGRFRQRDGLPRGRNRDTDWFSITAEEWPAPPGRPRAALARPRQLRRGGPPAALPRLPSCRRPRVEPVRPTQVRQIW